MRQKEVAIEPSPELIDVLWGSYYLATGSYAPIGRMIKLLPLANDKDSVDNLTTGSAAKFTLASNAVRGERELGVGRRTAHISGRTRCLPSQLLKPCEKHLSVDQFKPRRYEWDDKGVFPQQRSKIRGGREKTFRGAISLQHSHQRPNMVGGYEKTWLVGLDLIDDPDAAQAPSL
jgi:hypothetical protein